MTDAVTSATTAATTSAATTASQGLAENFELFLGLLTEQLQNQDPLDPLDSNEFVNQLVQFSSVEQQIAQNQNLETLVALQTAAANTTAVGYIGRDAAVAGGAAQLSNGRASWAISLEDSAASVTARILDADGEVVAQSDLGARADGAFDYAWDGVTDAGATAADGVYTLELTATNADGEALSPATAGYFRVGGVDLAADPPSLLTIAGSAALADVSRLREPA